MKGKNVLWTAAFSGKVVCFFVLSIGLLFLISCAAGLTYPQQRELECYKSKGLAVEEKTPGAAAALGLLPGGGSFYTRNYGLGVIGVLFYPLSITWEPINGYQASQTINYYATKESIRLAIAKEMQKLDEQLEDKEISEREYILEGRKIRAKYAADYD
jgi:hypothetical protein